jgi:lipopolysaccharide cholinephosphotransferase
MTASQTQALREKYNPDGSALRRDQLALLDMLCFVADICRQNGIQWWLSSGTLLGAARHKGFIPWDDDLDIVMLREDYEKFEKLMLSFEDERYVFHCMRTDVEYVNVFGKFRRREGRIQVASRRYRYYEWAGIGFDVFAIEKTSAFSAHISKLLYQETQHLTSYIGCGWLRRPLIRLIEIVHFNVTNPILRLIGKINPKGQYHYVLGTGWPRHTFYMKDTFPLSEAEFEGHMFPLPKDMDAYLTNVYGDWRKIPSDDTIKKFIHCQEYINEIYGADR